MLLANFFTSLWAQWVLRGLETSRKEPEGCQTEEPAGASPPHLTLSGEPLWSPTGGTLLGESIHRFLSLYFFGGSRDRNDPYFPRIF